MCPDSINCSNFRLCVVLQPEHLLWLNPLCSLCRNDWPCQWENRPGCLRGVQLFHPLQSAMGEPFPPATGGRGFQRSLKVNFSGIWEANSRQALLKRPAFVTGTKSTGTAGTGGGVQVSQRFLSRVMGTPRGSGSTVPTMARVLGEKGS